MPPYLSAAVILVSLVNPFILAAGDASLSVNPDIETPTDLLSSDTDGDGLTNTVEIQQYRTDPSDSDTDGDNLTDSQEVALGTDPTVVDTDGDGLEDGSEVNRHNTDPTHPDTDRDNLDDGTEVTLGTDPTHSDTDRDGLKDSVEVTATGIGNISTNPTDADTDGDGITDAPERRQYQTNPADADTDSDGITDAPERRQYNTGPTDADTDSDGITDAAEIRQYQTNPRKADTDGDGVRDPLDRNPLNPPRCADTNPHIDSDSDGLTDAEECQRGTHPLDADTDNDGLTDGEEVSQVSANGVYLPGSHPLVKDIHLVHVTTEGASVNRTTLSEMFASLNVANPVIKSGIQLHTYDTHINSTISVGESEDSISFLELRNSYADELLADTDTARNLLIVVSDIRGHTAGKAVVQSNYAISERHNPTAAAHEILHMTAPRIQGGCDGGFHVCSQEGLLSQHGSGSSLSDKTKQAIDEKGLIRND